MLKPCHKSPVLLSEFLDTEMSEEVDCSWLPSDFITDDLFFMEVNQRRPEATLESSSSNPLFSGSHTTLASSSPDCLAADGEEEEHLARLTLRMAQSFLLDDEDEDHPESTLWAWPSLMEPTRQLQNESTLAVHSDAKGQVMGPRLKEPYGDLFHHGILGHHRKVFPALPAPYGYRRICDVASAFQKLRTAQQQSTTRGGGGGLPLGMFPSPCPLLQTQHQQHRSKTGSWYGARVELLNTSVGTGVFIPRTSRSEAQPPSPRGRRAAAIHAGGSNELSNQKQRNRLPHLPSMISHEEMQLPREWTY